MGADADRHVGLVVQVEAGLGAQLQADCVEAVVHAEIQQGPQGLEGQARAAPLCSLKAAPVDACQTFRV